MRRGSFKSNVRRAGLLTLLVIATTSRAHAQADAFAQIESAYAPYLDHDDPFGWPAKAWSLSANEYKFWRGSKDLFFLWCNDHCADWKADGDAFVSAHGDLHQGNIGTYASDAGFGEVAFGMVDFDDSNRLPFQIELLQGFITLRLMADDAGLVVEDSQWARLDAALIETYRGALHDRKDAADYLAVVPRVAKMVKSAHGVSYTKQLEKFCDGTTFRTKITSSKGELTEILRPIDASEYDAFARALAEACENDPAMAAKMRSVSAQELRGRIKSIALRTRLGSSGSQGLKKYLALLDRPLVGIDSDVILYLKQEIPTAAERAGYIAIDPRRPGARAQQLMNVLTSPHAFLNSHASLHGDDYWVSLKEPWSAELDDRVKNETELLEAAKVWGTVAGSALQSDIEKAHASARVNQALIKTLSERADQYVAYQHDAFIAFTADPRASALKQHAAAAFAALGK